METPENGRLLRGLFVKNDIFSYMHTSENHALHQESYARLQRSNPEIVKELIGDARLSLEELKENYKKLLLSDDDSEDDEKVKFAIQAAGIQVLLYGLVELRTKMAANFNDPTFLNESNDRKLIVD